MLTITNQMIERGARVLARMQITVGAIIGNKYIAEEMLQGMVDKGWPLLVDQSKAVLEAALVDEVKPTTGHPDDRRNGKYIPIKYIVAATMYVADKTAHKWGWDKVILGVGHHKYFNPKTRDEIVYIRELQQLHGMPASTIYLGEGWDANKEWKDLENYAAMYRHKLLSKPEE